VVARVFLALGIPVTAIDGDPKRIEAAKRFGHKVYFGDATRTDVLAAAGAGEAAMIFVTIDDREACLRAIRAIRKRFPQIKIMARAHDRIHAIEMMETDADFFVRDTFESSIVLASEGLKRLGESDETIERVMEEFRRADADLMSRQKAHGLYAVSEGGETIRLDKT
jgi:voltage-gated potassium channel Kch